MLVLRDTKLIASLALFILTLLCGYLPVRFILNQNMVQYAMFAGGGVLMATAFCHLIPETIDHYNDYKTGVIAQFSTLSPTTNVTINATTTSANISVNFNEINNNTHTLNQTTLLPPIDFNHSQYINTPNSKLPLSIIIPTLEICLCCGFFFMYIVEQLMVRFINTHTHEHPCDSSTGQLVVGPSVASLSANSTSSTGTHFYKFIRGFLIVSAFGAHAIFDGVAIGSQPDEEKVWTIFFAICCHKLIIAAVVGLELFAATLESHLWTLIHLSIFSIMSPIGIILVVVMQDSLHIDENDPTMILLQSFATGTLLYIVFVEILQPKQDQRYEKNKLGKSFSLIAGFTLMVLVLTLIGE